jgi:hypothetical protein
MDILEHSAETFFLPGRGYFQCTIMQHAAVAAVALDDTVSGGACGSGVDAEDTERAVPEGGRSGWTCGFHRPKSTAFVAWLPELCRRVSMKKTAVPIPGTTVTRNKFETRKRKRDRQECPSY